MPAGPLLPSQAPQNIQRGTEPAVWEPDLQATVLAGLLLAMGAVDGRAHEAEGDGGAPPLLGDDEARDRTGI